MPRPKKKTEVKNKEAFKKFCRDRSMRCAEIVLTIVENEDAKDSDRIRGAELIIAYGYGKPKEDIDIDVSGQLDTYDIKTLAKLAELK